MKALVTGGTGFVGSHVARALVADGHEVCILRRETSRLDALAGLAYKSVLGDVLDEAALLQASAGCDWVFHVAAVSDYWRADKARMFEVNVEGTRRVLRAAKAAGVARVVFTSSAAAVGHLGNETPADENAAFNLLPERFPYGYSKAQAEAAVQQAVQDGQDVVIVNPVVVFGPGDLNLISGSMLKEIKRFGPLTTVTSGGVAVIDVRDVARGHLAAAEQGRSGQRYLLGSQNCSFRDLFALVAEVVGAGRPRLYVPGGLLSPLANIIDLARAARLPIPVDANQTRLGAHKIYFDFSKMWNELGRPQVGLRQSIQDTYDWYVEHGYMVP